MVFDLLTLEKRVKNLRQTRRHGLTDYEKKRLLQAIQPMNFYFADRDQVKDYGLALENKIRCINAFTDNGVDIFQSKIKFPLDFVYPMMVDFFHLIEDYTSVKDMFLYKKHREENDKYLSQPEPTLDCYDCSFYTMVDSIEKDRKNRFVNEQVKKNYGTHLYNK